jgi:septal ring factor EnvC (AmiA/AmiB activator)
MGKYSFINNKFKNMFGRIKGAVFPEDVAEDARRRLTREEQTLTTMKEESRDAALILVTEFVPPLVGNIVQPLLQGLVPPLVRETSERDMAQFRENLVGLREASDRSSQQTAQIQSRSISQERRICEISEILAADREKLDWLETQGAQLTENIEVLRRINAAQNGKLARLESLLEEQGRQLEVERRSRESENAELRGILASITEAFKAAATITGQIRASGKV